jgi:hypothetical protein
MADRVKLTEAQIKLLKAVAKGLNGQSSAWNIASRLGYRPSKNGIPAVTQMCRALNRKYPSDNKHDYGGDLKYGNIGRLLVRIPPKDQWDCAIWCITKEGRALLASSAKTGE